MRGKDDRSEILFSYIRLDEKPIICIPPMPALGTTYGFQMLRNRSFEFEKMIMRRIELDEQPCRAELVAVSDIAFSVQRLHQAPDPTT
jgi:hypothetical protein